MVSIKREQIVIAARSFLGVKFLHQGIDPETGLDCRGLLLAVAQKLGHETRQVHRMNYKRKPDPVEFREALEGELERFWIRPADLPPTAHCPLPTFSAGHVLHIFFPRQTPDQATHAGIVAQGPYEPMLIHAFGTDLGGSVIEEPLRRWEKYLAGAFRFPGVV
jgi:cell wall-associated NlpC family hydrolase